MASKSPEQLHRCALQRADNEAARRRGEPLPFPNRWDVLDPTKVDAASEDVTEERLLASTREFMRRCRPRPRRRHVI